MAKEFLIKNQDKTYLILEQERTEIQDQDHTVLHQISVIMMVMCIVQPEQWPTSITVRPLGNDNDLYNFNNISFYSFINYFIATSMNQRKQNRCVEHQQEIVALCID